MLELHVNKQHYKGGAGCSYIQSIQDDGKILATYNQETLKTDLEVCRPYIGQVIKFVTVDTNEKTNRISINCCQKAILQGIKEEESGIKYLLYDPLPDEKEESME